MITGIDQAKEEVEVGGGGNPDVVLIVGGGDAGILVMNGSAAGVADVLLRVSGCVRTSGIPF